MRARSWSCLVLVGACGCSDAREAQRVQLPVLLDGSGVGSARTNLGYDISLSEARLALGDLEFAIAGQLSASLWRRLYEVAVPSASAHPGHYENGEVTGELRGQFLASWLPLVPAPLGSAELIVGAYGSANFTFARAGAESGVAADDPLWGHTARLAGEASRDGAVVAFEIVVDSPEGRELVGVPFEVQVGAQAPGGLALALLLRDPVEGDTLFDDVDFLALSAGSEASVQLGPADADAARAAAYLEVRRRLQTHDHYQLQAADRN